jgi:hypothetical protein
VGKRQRPKTEVGSCVRDTAQDELDRLDNLVDSDLACVVLIVISVGLGGLKSLGFLLRIDVR